MVIDTNTSEDNKSNLASKQAVVANDLCKQMPANV